MNKRRIARVSSWLLVVIAGGLLATATQAGGGTNCPDIYNPVICSNGVIYPNACYASLAKAKNCIPYGDD
jgi:hypothetical protein